MTTLMSPKGRFGVELSISLASAENDDSVNRAAKKSLEDQARMGDDLIFRLEFVYCFFLFAINIMSTLFGDDRVPNKTIRFVD